MSLEGKRHYATEEAPIVRKFAELTLMARPD